MAEEGMVVKSSLHFDDIPGHWGPSVALNAEASVARRSAERVRGLHMDGAKRILPGHHLGKQTIKFLFDNELALARLRFQSGPVR